MGGSRVLNEAPLSVLGGVIAMATRAEAPCAQNTPINQTTQDSDAQSAVTSLLGGARTKRVKS